MFSFTKPVSKHILKSATKIWGFYFIIAFVILLAFRANLMMQIEESKQEQDAMKEQQEKIVRSTGEVVEESKRLYFELDVTNRIKDRDSKLRMQIENILAMVPDGVAISEIRFENNSLYIKGITRSQELFETALQSQLNAIYKTSKASFYKIPSGWLNFESVSKTTDYDGLEQRVEEK